MKRLIFALPLAALLCSLSGAATAATILGPLTAVTAVDNLLVDGTQVDVTFAHDTTWSAAFPTNNPFYNGNSHGAEDAANAIASALSSAGATGLAGGLPSGGNSVWVPFSPPNPQNQNFISTWAFSNAGAAPTVWSVVPDPEFVGESVGGPNFYAVVTPQTSSVPDPASGWLMLMGLVALFARKRLAA
jgi:hypothetical protein